MGFIDRLESLLTSRNIKKIDFTDAIGVRQAAFFEWKKNGSYPNTETVIKIAQYFNISLDYLLAGDENAQNKCIIPILDQELSAGNGCLVPENDAPQGLLELPYMLRKEYGENLSALYVKGDSMEPTLHNGDLIVCDSLGWDSGEGLYAVRLNGKGYVKRIQVGNGKILIKSDNPKYDTIEEPIESQNFQVIGKVHFVGTVRI